MKELRLKNGSVIQFGEPRGEKFNGRGYLWLEVDGEIQGPFQTGDVNDSPTPTVPDNQLYRVLHHPDRRPVRQSYYL